MVPVFDDDVDADAAAAAVPVCAADFEGPYFATDELCV